MEKDEELKIYPKLHMMNRINKLLDDKEGLSEFEKYSGVSETVATGPVRKKQRMMEPRTYNLDEV